MAPLTITSFRTSLGLYGLGQVLKKKFRLLRISYTVFMFALVVGVGLFVLGFSLG